jgi:hypothetical protein
MNYAEVSGDLFKASEDYVLAHCVSADCAMGIKSDGSKFPCIALQFRERFPDIADAVRKTNPSIGNAVLYEHPTGRATYNLITKHNYWNKPTLDTLKLSLTNLRTAMEINNHFKLAIPMLGAGADKLSWVGVKREILNAFESSNIAIIVYIR